MKGYKLIDRGTGREVKVGDILHTENGIPVTVAGFEAPRHVASSGRVYVKGPESQMTAEYFPHVFNLVIVTEALIR